MSTVIDHAYAIAAACAGGALTYLRHQVSGFVKWVSKPVTVRLPWNRNLPASQFLYRYESVHVSLIIEDITGSKVTYQKTSLITVEADTMAQYSEGVTGDGSVESFRTSQGHVIQAREGRREHGFHICMIDLEKELVKKEVFSNTFSAALIDSFTKDSEDWTQEIVKPTKELGIRIIFPSDRHPQAFSCHRIKGVESARVARSAKLQSLGTLPCISWEIKNPNVGEIYKIEWNW